MHPIRQNPRSEPANAAPVQGVQGPTLSAIARSSRVLTNVPAHPAHEHPRRPLGPSATVEIRTRRRSNWLQGTIRTTPSRPYVPAPAYGTAAAQRRTSAAAQQPTTVDEAPLPVALPGDVADFVRERCAVGAGHSVSTRAMRDAWSAWALAHGFRRGSASGLSMNLRIVVPGLDCLHANRTRPRTYTGIGLREAGS